MTIAILSAMEEECASLIEIMQDQEQINIAGRTYYTGTLWGKKAVVVFSRWGKVAAASTTVVLIREFNVTEVIFTGVAGAIERNLNVGDIVIGTKIYQHDMDARPMLAQYKIPLLGITYFETDADRRELVARGAKQYLTTQFNGTEKHEHAEEFNINNPKVVLGGIATGDQFVSNVEKARAIQKDLPEVVCVEMEGSAVAQVCGEYDVKFSIIRTISDSADDEASIDFPKFVKAVAKAYSLGIIKNVFNDME